MAILTSSDLKSSLPRACLMAISESEMELSSSLASLCWRERIALVEMRPGEAVAQMKAAVSSRRRTQMRPSINCSSSASLIGFHQSGSCTLTRPANVPNAGFSEGAAVVGTRSTTGVPRRQMVTRSPLSAALMSSGSLFLASATLTFMPSIIAISNSYVNPCAVAGAVRLSEDE